MKPSGKISKTLLAAVALSAVAGCANKDSYRGYMFDPALADAILPGIDNRVSVESTLGSPTLESTFDENVWYYVNRVDRNRSLYWPEAKSRKIMLVRFNGQGTVSEVTNYDLSSARDIDPVNDKTRSRGSELNFFQELFMNVGRFVGAQGGPQGANGPGPNGS